jgi:hypothetical protein
LVIQLGQMFITAQSGSRRICSKKPPQKQGPWIIQPGVESIKD